MLTKKSMMIDDVYLESLIDGYTTISADGRESLASQIQSVNVENRNGSVYRGKTYSSRSIAVSFIIEGDSYSDLYDKIDILNEVLGQENVTVSFTDEQDKFYNASAFTNVSISTSYFPGSESYIASGSFDVFCADPFKYSKNLIIEEPDFIEETDEEGNSYLYPTFSIDYDGNYKSYPIFETRFYDSNRTWDSMTGENSPEEFIKDYYTTAYEPLEIESGNDFPSGGAYILDPEEVSVFSEDALYFSYEDSTDSYIIADISEGDIIADDTTYYILHESLANVYDPDESYYVLNEEHLSPTVEDVDGFADSPQEGDDGAANEENDNAGACGYVGFVKDDESVLQFGNPEAGEYSEVDMNPQLVNTTFSTESSYSSAVKSTWLTNAINIPYGSDNRVLAGNFAEALRRNAYYASLVRNQVVYKKTNKSIAYDVRVKQITTRKAKSCVIEYYLSATLKAKTIEANKTMITLGISFDGGSTWKNHVLLKKKKGVKWAKNKKKTVGSNKSPQKVTINLPAATTQNVTPKIRLVVSGTRASTFQFGATSCNAISVPVYATMPTNSYYLKPTYGSSTKDKWHGPILSRMLPADGNGEFGSDKFKMEVSGKFCVGNGVNFSIQRGIVGIYAIGGTYSNGVLSNQKLVAGLEIQKTADSSNTATIREIINGSTSRTYSSKCVSFNESSKFTVNIIKGSDDASKDGSQFSISFKNKNPNVSPSSGNPIDISLTNTKVYAIAIGFFQNGALPAMAWAGIDSVKFTKYNVEARQINAFKASDILKVDCGACTVLLNEMPALNLSALGNDWESMCLTPGFNQFSAIYSEYAREKKAYRRCRASDNWSSDAEYYVKNGNTYTRVHPTEEEFNASIVDDRIYYIYESCEPEFRLKYREVYI